MSCGCNNSAITVVGDGVTADVAVSEGGSKFTVSARQTIAGIADTDTVDLEIDGDLILRALVRLVDSNAIALLATPDGVRADLLVDPNSTADVAITADGLRVDVPSVTIDGVPGLPGQIIEYAGILPLPSTVECYGQDLQSTAHPITYDRLTLFGSATSVDAAQHQITGLETTRYAEPGMVVEASGFSTRTTIVTVDSDSQITVAAAADYTVVGDGTTRIFVWGESTVDPTFFKAPDLRDTVLAGLGDMGGTLKAGADVDTTFLGGVRGSNDATIGLASLPLHDHAATVADPGHGHGVSDPGHTHNGVAVSAGGHVHEAGPTAGDRSFVTANGQTTGTGLQQALIDPSLGADLIGVQLGAAANLGVPQQTNSQATAPSGTHQHNLDIVGAATGVSVGPSGTGITVDVEPAGSATPTPLDVRQRTTYVRMLLVVD